RTALAENLEAERVRQPVGDAGNRERAGRAGREGGGEDGDVLVFYRLPDVADRAARGVADRRPQGDRAVADYGRKDRAADTGHRAAQELPDVDQGRADVREGP